MKKTLLSVTLLAFLGLISPAFLFAQGTGKLLKVTYITTPQSPKILALVKAQLQGNMEQYNKLSALLSDYKFYHTLYVDPKTHSSVFSLDSVHTAAHVSVFGNVVYALRDDKNTYQCKEKFGATEYLFKGSTKELEWNVTKETSVINGFNCLKATLKNSPDVVVWFAPDVPVDNGPGYYYGLPGLVLKVQTNYDETVTAKITYSSDVKAFKATYDKRAAEAAKEKSTSLKEVITSKGTFMRLLETKIKG
jgi:GLPGLI family protein